jgi:hypothetical protein
MGITLEGVVFSDGAFIYRGKCSSFGPLPLVEKTEGVSQHPRLPLLDAALTKVTSPVYSACGLAKTWVLCALRRWSCSLRLMICRAMRDDRKGLVQPGTRKPTAKKSFSLRLRSQLNRKALPSSEILQSLDTGHSAVGLGSGAGHQFQGLGNAAVREDIQKRRLPQAKCGAQS